MSDQTLISVAFRGLSGNVDLNVPEGSTVGDALAQAGVSDQVSVRQDGAPVDPNSPVAADAEYTTTPPALKQGR